MKLLLLFWCLIIFVCLNTNILLFLHHLLGLLELIRDNSSEQGGVLYMSMQFRTLQIGQFLQTALSSIIHTRQEKKYFNIHECYILNKPSEETTSCVKLHKSPVGFQMETTAHHN